MKVFRILPILLIFSTSLVVAPLLAHADATSDIQSKIDANNQQVDALKAEIAAFQKQLDALGEKKNTLQSTIDTLTISQKQLTSQIRVTQSKISSANLEIQRLSLSINNKESSIAENQDVIAKMLRDIAIGDETPLIATLISKQSFGDAWRTADQAMQLNTSLTKTIETLRSIRTELAANRDSVAAAKADLVSLQKDLSLQKRSIDASKTYQQQLLSQTKNQESNYQKLIAQKQAAEQSFESELTSLQAQLNLIVHPGLLPKVGSGVLTWPFSSAFMFDCANRKSTFGNLFCITQYFGTTPFATANPQIYNNHGHNAIDIAAPIGTPLHAALGGTVLATGNTDLAHDVKGHQCYSFGKWVMIVHGNGLNTMYAHLSEIDVSKGQSVAVGQVIGLSGMTGYATGPHLHFGVYATEGTQIQTLGQFKGVSGTACANASMPVASLDAYLNPLSYL